MSIRRHGVLAVAALTALVGVLSGRWLLAPLGRRELEIPTPSAFSPPKLAPLAKVAPPVPVPRPPSEPTVVRAKPPETRPGAPETWQSTLLVGLDRRPDARGAGLADTILIAVFDEKSGHAGVISVPRDLWVTIPDYGDDRINVIPMVARRLKVDALGLFERVLLDTLGVRIEHGVVVDLAVFEHAVDAVGGVQVDVPCAIVDSFRDERVEGGRRKLDLGVGPALLDGPTAAMYVRSRHGRSDFGRSRRQQAVLLGLRDRVLAGDGWTLVPKLWGEIESAVHTDFRRLELLGLARRALELDRGRLHGLVLAPPLTVGHETEDGKAVLLPEKEAITRAIAGLFSAAPPGEPPSTVCPAADVALKGR